MRSNVAPSPAASADAPAPTLVPNSWVATVEAACGSSRARLPALALTLRRCGGALPPRALGVVLPLLWNCLQSTLGVERPTRAADATAALWALRCLRELAKLCAPSADRPRDAAAASVPLDDDVPEATPHSSATPARTAGTSSAAGATLSWAEVRNTTPRLLCRVWPAGILMLRFRHRLPSTCCALRVPQARAAS